MDYQIISDDENEIHNLKKDQYIICIYLRFYANGMMADYHFIRYEDGEWSEKWKGMKPAKIDTNYYENRWDWKKVISLRVSR